LGKNHGIFKQALELIPNNLLTDSIFKLCTFLLKTLQLKLLSTTEI